MSILRSIRTLLVAFLCTLMMFFIATPAFAFDNAFKEKSSEGTIKVEKAKDQVKGAADSGLRAMREAQYRTDKGFNRIKENNGSNQAENMPGDKEGTTVKEVLQDALDNIRGEF